MGTVKNGRFYRVHVTAAKANLADAKRVQAAFLKTVRLH